MERTVGLEYADGEWFVARPKAEAVDQFTHDKIGGGYRSAEAAADAAIAYAAEHDLPVMSRTDMIEEAEDMLAFIANDARGHHG